jgi:PPOX class probable F420-dependent enzyme
MRPRPFPAVYPVAMFDERPDIQARLDREQVAWMTTVNPAGQPQSSAVWFIVQADAIVVYSLRSTPRTRNIATNPRVSINLNSTPSGDDIVIIEGRAEVARSGPPADQDPEYVAKYADAIARLGMTPQAFAIDYPVRIHIHPTRLRAS